ncbi:MAG TPA: 50S ribosomal protein L15 [Candidatus Nanoarchaeia archaeon]
MKLHELSKIKTKKAKRLGRGESSGKGGSAGRGVKGQKQREKVKAGFEGGQLPIYQRLPQRRGKGNTQKTKAVTVTTRQLNKLPANAVVDEKNLREIGLIPKAGGKVKVKVVARGGLEKKLKVNLSVSQKAARLIEKVGGKLLNENPA